MENSLIKKTILSAGSKIVNVPLGAKVKFHYITRYQEGEETIVLDDSRKINAPMELIIGKKFKMEVWEAAVQTMALNEIASFKCDKSLVTSYPFVAKTLRDVRKPNMEKKSHCCAATLHTEGVGYDDLNVLITQPRDLEFVFELLSVETPEQYEKETWQMTENEKLDAVPILKEEGNAFYRNKEYDKAAAKYSTAIGILEQLMLKEKPKDEEWNELNALKLPILSNFSQCQLINKEYYSVIEHCSTILEADSNNVKALYRRAKAHVGAWNPAEAEQDLKRVVELDPSLSKLVSKDLAELEAAKKQKEDEDRKFLEGKMFSS